MIDIEELTKQAFKIHDEIDLLEKKNGNKATKENEDEEVENN